MKPECAAAVRAAAGDRQLSDSDMSAIEERLRGATKQLKRQNPEAWARMAPAERLTEAAKLAQTNRAADIAAAHESAIRNASAKAANDATLAAVPAGQRMRALYSAAFMDHSGGTSIESSVRGMHALFQRMFTDKQERFLEDPTKSQAVAQELFTPGSSGDVEAKAAADAVRKAVEEGRTMANRAGIRISYLDNWHLPQPWDWTRLSYDDRETWIQKMLTRLDLREFINPDGTDMTAAQIRHTLEESWLTLQTNGANKRAARDGSGYGSAGVGRRHNAPRQLHFKDAQAWLDTMREYGTSDNVGSILREHFNRLSRDIAVARAEGGNADANFKQRAAKALADDLAVANSAGEKRAAQRLYNQTLSMWEVLTRGHSAGNSAWAARMGAIRSILSASKLGTLVSQQPSDTLIALNYLKDMGFEAGGAGRKFFEGIAALPDSERKAWMRRAGVWADNAHDVTSRFGDTEVWNRVSKFLNGTVYKRSGMRAADRGTTSLIAESFYGTLGRRVGEHATLADMPRADRELLAHYGITQEHWNVLRLAEIDRGFNDDRTNITPDGIYDIPAEKLRDLAEASLAAKGEAGAQARAKIAEANARESEWIGKRLAKLADFKERAAKTLAAMRAKAAVRAGHAEGVAAVREELLRAHIARAEVEGDIGRYLLTEAHQGKILKFLDAVEEGASRERAILRERTHPDNKSDAVIERISDTPGLDERAAETAQDFAKRVGSGGEALGQRRARLEARIADMHQRIADMQKDRSDAIDARGEDFAKATAEREKDLAAFVDEMRARSARRRELANAYKSHEAAVDEETLRLKDDAVLKIQSAFQTVLHAAGRGFSGSTLREQSRLGLLQHEAGTFLGEAVRMLWMIRQVPMGLMMTHLHDVPAGLEGWAPRARYIAHYALGQAAATAIMVEAKHLVYGEDLENPLTLTFAEKLLAGAGLGPLLSTILFGSGNEEHDADWLGKLAGPAGDVIQDVARLVTEGRDAAEGKKPNFDAGKYESKWLAFVRSNLIPFMNFWYTKAAFNHMVYQQLQEKVSPGYNQRVQKAIHQRDKNRTMWWQQGQALPQRAPAIAGRGTP